MSKSVWTTSVSSNAARGYRSSQVPNTRPIVAIVDDDNAVGNAIEVLMRSVGLIAKAELPCPVQLDSAVTFPGAKVTIDFSNEGSTSTWDQIVGGRVFRGMT